MTSALERGGGSLRYADILLTPAAGGNFLVVFIGIFPGEARLSEPAAVDQNEHVSSSFFFLLSSFFLSSFFSGRGQTDH